MAARSGGKTRSRGRKKSNRRFRFQLSVAGVIGVAVVLFCLFFWMFMLGIWAGQTILLPGPARDQSRAIQPRSGGDGPVILRPQGKKTPPR